jgi:soluble lytic murein transglycosylase-like protein
MLSSVSLSAGKNYVYRTKNGKILLTDRRQKEDFAELIKAYEAKKEEFYSRYGDFYRNKYEPIVKKYAMLNGLDPELVHAIIEVESGYDYTAVSPVGAKGLMQLMDSTAEMLGVANVFDPTENIRAGTEYFARMLDRYNGNIDYALAAYNAGPTAVDRYKGVPNYPETKRYVKKIKKILNGITIVPTYTYNQPKIKKIEDKPNNLSWKRVDGKIVIEKGSRK